MLRYGLVIVAALCTICAAAPAHSEEGVNLSGSWTFTARISEDCNFDGTAHLTAVEPGLYEGELTARQDCPDLDITYLVRQATRARMIGNQVSVQSTILEFLEGSETEYYFPDNFTLTIKSDTHLYGALVSSSSAKPAQWYRSNNGIS